MGEDAEALISLIFDRALAVAGIRRHRFRNGVVEAKVERLELLTENRRLYLDGECRDRLADLSVIVDDLTDGEPPPEEVLTVSTGARANLLVVDDLLRFCSPQRLAELIQEQRDSVRSLDF